MLDLIPDVREGFCCSQMLMLMLLRARGEDNPQLIRAMHGLGNGLGFSNGPCGLLTGGAAVLGVLAGKGQPGEEAHPSLVPVINDYALWFYQRSAGFGGIACETVSQGLAGAAGAGAGGTPNMLHCGPLLLECWEKLLELNDAYGLDAA